MRSPENIVFAAVQLLPKEERDIVEHRWGLRGLTPCANVDEAAERLNIPRLLARRSYACAVFKLRASEITRRALAAFEQRKAA